MAQSYRSRFLAVQRNSETVLKALFVQLADAIGAELQRRVDADGNVPRSATFDIQQAAGDLVRRFFLGRNRNGEWAPLDILANGAVVPLSPYMRQLWESIRATVRIPVEQNAAILAKRLPPDVAYAMHTANRNPFVVAKGQVAEQVFRPNPLAAYDAPHTWVDANGYRLSDRVWNTATLTRRQIDAYLEEGIREGRGALQMSRELRQFLTPGESLRRTDKPYGTTASFSGMRLARTEITRASNEAHRASAAMNPFVAGMKWNLSARHPRIDICDNYARGGPNGDGVYAIEDYPGIPHPQCLCRSSNVMIEDPDAMLEQLRADIRAAKQEFTDLVGPLEVDRFTNLLLGQGLEEVRVAPGVMRVIAPPPPPVVVPARPVVVPSASDIFGIALPQSDEARRLMTTANETITLVHRMPTGLASVPVHVRTDTFQGNNGTYVVDMMFTGPRFLEVNSTLARKEFTFIHEFGHYLDHQLLGLSVELGDMTRSGGVIHGVEIGLRNRFWDVARQSQTIADMDLRINELRAARPLLGDGGVKTPEERLLEYYLNGAEIWARAYSQWVSLRSGRLGYDVSSRARQWADDEFLPIATVIDDMFRAMGLL